MSITNRLTSPKLSQQETIKKCDNKCIESINYILKKWNMDSILLIDLVHSDQVTKWKSSMTYVPPSTVIIDDSDEYIHYLYNNKTSHIQTIHEVLAIMIAEVMRQIRFIAINKTYSAEDYKIWWNTKSEVERYLSKNYKKYEK